MAGKVETDPIERLTDLGHISSGVGHHVINAFAAIVSNAELLRLDLPVPSVADPAALAETIINTAIEASNVARRLIDYSRPVTSTESDRAAFTPHAVRLDQLVAEIVEAEREHVRPGIVWEESLGPIAPIKGHEAQLRSMVLHILNNAYDAMPEGGGRISVATSTDKRGWNVLEICDSGVGMTRATLERSVEPFFSTKPGRLGVGLSIANGIWRRHRGTLSVQSRPGEGSRLVLCVEPSRDGA